MGHQGTSFPATKLVGSPSKLGQIISVSVRRPGGFVHVGFPSPKKCSGVFLPAAFSRTDRMAVFFGAIIRAQFEVHKLWGDLWGPSVVFSSKRQ